MALPRRLRELALFAGAGGGLLGGHLLGHVPVCAVEIDSYCRRVLFARQRDGIFPPFPVWDDVVTFDGKPWRGLVDVISGGFPCQNISSAGDGTGLDGEKSGLWREFARIISEVAPEFVFIENSPHLRTRGLDVVLSDLARMGFDAEWCVLGAADIGAPHQRDRMWILARCAANAAGQRREGAALDGEHREGRWSTVADHRHASDTDDSGQRDEPMYGEMARTPVSENRESERGGNRAESGGTTRHLRRRRSTIAGARDVPDADGYALRLQQPVGRGEEDETALARGVDWWTVDRVQGVVDVDANRLDRIAATGNAQVAFLVPIVWEILERRLRCR